MIDPSIAPKDLKHYPHFDAPLSPTEAEAIVTDPSRVEKNSFFPLLKYYSGYQPYRSGAGGKPKPKKRPIRYAARKDAYIFAHYRKIVSELYEARLSKLGISESVLAYRHIPVSPHSHAGKCNIDFANDAFQLVANLGNCVAIALDIASYFESIDHSKIREIWCDLLGVSQLPEDHYAVFKNLTRYHFVDVKRAYRRLGILKTDPVTGIEGYSKSFKDMDTQICTPQEFREKIAGKSGKYDSLIEKNPHDYGIPQGVPISDLVANFYLLKFDQSMFQLAKELDGKYVRYSDDILFIIPTDNNSTKIINTISAAAKAAISEAGSHLRIKEEKTCVVEYFVKSGGQTFKHLSGPSGRNGLEYLGFRYDGKNVFIRDSTISRLFRKASKAAKAASAQHVQNNPKQDTEGLKKSFNFSAFFERHSKVRREAYFSHKAFDHSNMKTWTFYTYVKRASGIFGKKGFPITRQMRNYKKFSIQRIHDALEKSVSSKTSE